MLASSAPRYVRCIKPNGKMAPGEVDSHDVCRQLRCAGMLDTIRIRKEGYSIRKSQDEFAKRYYCILAQMGKGSKSEGGFSAGKTSQICMDIFETLLKDARYAKVLDKKLKKWQIGLTKVFMKEEVRQLLENALYASLISSIVTLQKYFRRHLARRLRFAMTVKRFFMQHQKCEQVTRRRDQLRLHALCSRAYASFRLRREIRKRVESKAELRKKKQKEESERKAREAKQKAIVEAAKKAAG